MKTLLNNLWVHIGYEDDAHGQANRRTEGQPAEMACSCERQESIGRRARQNRLGGIEGAAAGRLGAKTTQRRTAAAICAGSY